MEAINEGFHARELHGKPFKYNQEERSKIKQKIITTLPTNIQLNKQAIN